MDKEFIAHGKCSFCVEDNIITIDATGPWNLEFFKDMHQRLSDIILNEVDYNNFAILLILKGDSLAVQDALDYHLHIVRKGPTKAIALHYGFSNLPKMTLRLFKNVYDQAGLSNKSFSTSESAKAWLRTKLI